jgi:hypothetical protein
MLILDKHKAVERIVALTSVGAEAEPEQQAAAPADEHCARVAAHEPAQVAAMSPAARRRERRRQRRSLVSGPAHS